MKNCFLIELYHYNTNEKLTCDKPFQSNPCYKYYINKYDEAIYHRTHFGIKKPYKCRLCDKAFLLNFNVLVHIQTGFLGTGASHVFPRCSQDAPEELLGCP